MPEMRKDPIVERWVIVAPERASRPQDFSDTSQRRGFTGTCPFCAGSEAETPPELLAYRLAQTDAAGASEAWRVRVVPNKYPAVAPPEEPQGALMDSQSSELFAMQPALGSHEVIIETPRHVVSTSDLSIDQLCDVLAAYRDRLRALRGDARLRYGLVFKNVGAAAGASIEHTHSQLIATPVVPPGIQEELEGAARYRERHGGCVYCDLIAREQASGARIVSEREQAVAICPFASRFAFETWIVPRRHASHFEELDAETLSDAASLLRETIVRIESAAGRPAYNYVIHTAPFDMHPLGHYHWHIEIIPRLSKLAGFEIGTGMHINPVSPESAAAQLRDVRV